MLSNSFFFHQSLRRYTLAFGLVFTNLEVQRSDAYSVVQNAFRVPITQASKQKFYLQLMQDATVSNRPFNVLLPRISFIMSSMSYDSDRQKNQTNKYSKTTVDDTLYTFEPSPWNFTYNMTIWTANEHDGHQIIEQILPYFTPFYMLTVNELPSFNISRSVPLELSSISRDVNAESGEDTNIRTIKWDLSFTLKGYLYKPIKSGANIIKKVVTRVHDLDDIEEDAYSYFIEQDVVYPWESIESDDWTINQTITEDDVTRTINLPKP
jgi:hypothetical protein